MADEFIPPPEWAAQAHVSAELYAAMYKNSVAAPEAFWGAVAERFTWNKKWKTVKNTRFAPDVSIKWFEGGQLNITENCLDRHLPQRAKQTAIIWEGDNPAESRHITYEQLHAQVCRVANVLKSHGVKKGDRVTVYMPMIPDAAVALLACARIGAVHSVVFGGFSPEALRGRIEDSGSRIVITADEGVRGGKTVPLKSNVDAALAGCSVAVERVLVVRRTDGSIPWNPSRDCWLHEETAKVSDQCAPEPMDAEAPLFILYTSGSTGKPKGVVHTTGGYMVWAGFTFYTVFDYRSHPVATPNLVRGRAQDPALPAEDPAQPLCVSQDDRAEVFWCSADVGWVTGHSYIVYGPLLNGATSLMFEGIPSYPDFSRFWQVIDKHKVNIFYTAPTAIRSLMREGEAWVKKTSRASLRILGSVGEPINPEAWLWYWRVCGDSRCPIVDTWWQTETGGHMINTLPGAHAMKPGSAGLPFFGVQPVIVDQSGAALEGVAEGMLCIADSWPGQARTLWGDHARFEQTYFSTYKGLYFTGDGAKRDADGYYWITGRVDDVLNVSGHRIGTAEVESALVGHHHVTEAAVVGCPHDIKGTGIYCYVTLQTGVLPSAEIEKELKNWVRQQIGPIANPDHIHFTPHLPKTRSGKIMRRILRKIAEGDVSNLGDTSTLLNPEIVGELVRNRRS